MKPRGFAESEIGVVNIDSLPESNIWARPAARSAQGGRADGVLPRGLDDRRRAPSVVAASTFIEENQLNYDEVRSGGRRFRRLDALGARRAMLTARPDRRSSEWQKVDRHHYTPCSRKAAKKAGTWRRRSAHWPAFLQMAMASGR